MTDLLTSYTFQIVALGASLLGIICGIVGNFAVLKKESLLGDVISHAALPGICLSYIVVGRKNLLLLLLGAFISGLVANFLINSLAKKKLAKFDNLLSLILSTFFGLGVVLITYIQKLPGANKAGLNKFIFGQASAILKEDIYIVIAVCLIVLFLVVLYSKQFKLIVFDEVYARTIYGKKIKFYSLVLYFSIIVCIIIGLEMVGVIMMSSLLIIPAAAARQWSNNFLSVILLSAVIGGGSAFFGTLVSASSLNLPTGPVIVVVLSVIVIFSLLFSKKRGLVAKYILDKKTKKMVIEQLGGKTYD